jgi:3D (Asp-Asp-Asp) domain-containing protein
MVTMITTALMGFFVYTSLGTTAPIAEAVEQTPVGPTYSVAMTGYNAVPEQTDGDPFTTASGAYSNPEVVAARSVDLAEELPFGTVIEIVPSSSSPSCGLPLVEHQIGLRVIADSMHPRMRNKIDLLFDQNRTVEVSNKTMNPALALGLCSDVEIRVVGFVEIAKIPRTQTELQAVVRASALAVKQ